MPVIGWYRSLSLTARFTISAFALSTIIAGFVATVAAQQLEKKLIERDAQALADRVSLDLGPTLSSADFRGAPSEERYQELARQVSDLVSDPRIREVKIWAADGTLVYSPDHGMIGYRYHLGDDFKAATTGELSILQVRLDGTGPNGADEQAVQTFAPIRSRDGSILGVYEVRESIVSMTPQLNQIRQTIGLSLLVGLGFVYLGLFGIVHRASRQLRSQTAQLHQLRTRREIDRLKAEFAGTVSHELRNPLTSLVGYSELLLSRGPQEGPHRDWIESINRQADRLSTMLDDIMSASMLDDGAVKLDAQPTNVQGAISLALSAIPVTATRVSIETNVPADLPEAVVDREKLSRVLTNLLQNAIKYSPEGGSVRISAQMANGQVRISVTDQGLGIPEAQLPRIFDRFHRVHAKSHPEIHGTGLGLYISKRLVELQGGSLWAESGGPGMGTTLHLELAPTQTARARSLSVSSRPLVVGTSH